MGSVRPLTEQRVLFARDVPADTNHYLQQAAATPQSDRAEALLKRAAVLSPGLLAVNVARYKFHFYRGQLAEAEAIVRETLESAAAQGGFDADWTTHTGPLAGREETESPQRYYLYALKALAFISLRQQDRARAADVLEALQRLDPVDLVGGSVIGDLMDGSADDDGDEA